MEQTLEVSRDTHDLLVRVQFVVVCKSMVVALVYTPRSINKKINNMVNMNIDLSDCTKAITHRYRLHKNKDVFIGFPKFVQCGDLSLRLEI